MMIYTTSEWSKLVSLTLASTNRRVHTLVVPGLEVLIGIVPDSLDIGSEEI